MLVLLLLTSLYLLASSLALSNRREILVQQNKHQSEPLSWCHQKHDFGQATSLILALVSLIFKVRRADKVCTWFLFQVLSSKRLWIYVLLKTILQANSVATLQAHLAPPLSSSFLICKITQVRAQHQCPEEVLWTSLSCTHTNSHEGQQEWNEKKSTWELNAKGRRSRKEDYWKLKALIQDTQKQQSRNGWMGGPSAFKLL